MKIRLLSAAGVAAVAFATVSALAAPEAERLEPDGQKLPAMQRDVQRPAPVTAPSRVNMNRRTLAAPQKVLSDPEMQRSRATRSGSQRPAFINASMRDPKNRRTTNTQANGTEPLFSDPVAQKSTGAQGNVQLPVYAKASKRVTMNRRALDAARIDIDLFGETITAIRDRVDRQKAGTVIWHGHVAGNPDDFVTIVSRGAAWSGSVDYKGRKFELTGAPGQGLVFNEVDIPALPSNDDDGIIDPLGGAPAMQPKTAPLLAGAPIEQDLLVVYTDDACVGAGGVSGVDCSQVEASIVAAVADMNQSYLVSNVDIVSNLVGMLEVQYDEDAWTKGEMLSHIRNTNDGFIDQVHTTRDAIGADIVSFIVQDGDGYCGLGYVGGGAGSAFSYTMRSCLSNRTQHHEIGHNQGSSHARAQASNPPSGSYNFGFRRCNNGSAEDFGAPYFRTIMAYSCTSASRTGHFANPNVNYMGVPTGIDPNVDPDNAAYSARTLNERAAYMAAFRDPPVGPPPTTPPAAPSGLAASANGTDSIDISWFDNSSDETSFNIERSPDGANWTQIATLGADATNYSDNGLNPDTTYYYQVQAANSSGASAFSNTTSAKTDPLITAVDDLATGQIAVTGRISGSYSATHREDGAVQRITEKKQSKRTRGFEHIWIFNVTGGSGDVVMTAKAWIYRNEGVNFYYSTNGGANYNLMFTVNETRSSATAKRFTLPAGTSGEVLIRMVDAERREHEPWDTIFVDYLVITSITQGF